MYLNTFEYTFPKNKKIINLRKLGELQSRQCQNGYQFYAFLKTIIALSISFVHKSKKYDCRINKESFN